MVRYGDRGGGDIGERRREIDREREREGERGNREREGENGREREVYEERGRE